MGTKGPVLKPLALVTSALVWCTLNLHAQSPPTITTQPASQTNLAGTTVTFSVAVDGTGPFRYQWRFNGANLPNNIVTVAGNGSANYAGDGGPATNASLNYPYGVALDAFGNLYIADSNNDRIRKLDTNGIVSTVAGNGVYGTVGGFAGDGGAATNAYLYQPNGVALDAQGNLYIADTSNNRVRKVDTNGIITTVAGSGDFGYAGDGGAATNASLYYPWAVALDALGDLYIADSDNNRVRKVDTYGIITSVTGGISSGDGGPATNASVYAPFGFALDVAGNLYIAEAGTSRIRKVDSNGIITTVAGNGIAGYSGDDGAATNATLSQPWGLAFDVTGDLYIADSRNNRVRQVDTNGIITTVAGNGSATYAGDGGAATNASLNVPAGLAMDAAGNLYIGDGANQRIRKVFLAGYPQLTLNNVSSDSRGDYSVVVSSAYGSVTSAVATLTVDVAPSIPIQPASQLALPGSDVTLGVTAAGDPPLYYTWYFNATNLVQSGMSASLVVTNLGATNSGPFMVVVTNAYGSVTSQVATLTAELPPTITTEPASQTNLMGTAATFSVAVTGLGPFSYQWQFNGTNLLGNIISTVAGGGSGGDGGRATNASLSAPRDLALDAAGNLFIADTGNNRIRRVDTNGIITTVAGNGSATYAGDGGAATNASLFSPYGVAFDASDNLYIADSANNRIRRVDTNGIITTVAGDGTGGYSGDGGAATNASLDGPYSVALDALGDLYIADYANYLVRRIDINGIITSVAGNGSTTFSGDGGAATNAGLFPQAVALDSRGNLYFSDLTSDRIRKVDTNGVITTVAGGGSSGDGGPATNASLNWPWGLGLDAVGNLYIADSGNNRVRKVDLSGLISSAAGNGGYGFSGDGGAASNAHLKDPSGVALGAMGNLFIADTLNNRVRRVLLFSGTYPTLALADVGATNAGNYTVVITNAYGSVTSAVVTLTVEAPPMITVQPVSQSVLAGTSTDFSVVAVGSGPFEYLWYFDSTNSLQSSTNASVVVTNISAASVGQYTVVVTNSYGSITSQIATLTALFPPSVILQPASQTVVAGTNVIFSVTAGGTGPFTYQWQFNGTNVPDNVITTVAGSASGTFGGDGGPATNAGLLIVEDVTIDAAGNLYISDAAHQRIRKVDANGIITTVAGKGSGSFSGDGGAATNAVLSGAYEIALDGAGNLYIADTGFNRIRKVDTNGIITTVAGKAGNGYSGDGGAATNANLFHPQGIALDSSGNLYIADSANNRIRVVGTNGIITTEAGGGTGANLGDGGPATHANLSDPTCVAFDKVGNLYIADVYHNRIRKVDPNGTISTMAGNGIQSFSGDGGAPTNASLNYPNNVALDAWGYLYIADTFNDRVRKMPLLGYPTLALRNGSANNAGNYTVVITSPYGSVTSAVALLTVTIPRTPPQIITGDASFGVLSNHFGFNLSGAYGQTIVVDGSTDLVGWTPLFTNTVVGNPFYFSDPASTNYPSRFYRARLP